MPLIRVVHQAEMSATCGPTGVFEGDQQLSGKEVISELFFKQVSDRPQVSYK